MKKDTSQPVWVLQPCECGGLDTRHFSFSAFSGGFVILGTNLRSILSFEGLSSLNLSS